MNVPVGQVAHEEKADGGEGKLAQPYRDEHRVAAAEVEPVSTQQAKPKAGMRCLFDDPDFLEPDHGSCCLRLSPCRAEPLLLRVDKGRDANAGDRLKVALWEVAS